MSEQDELPDDLKDVIKKAKTQIFQDAGGVKLSYHQIGQIIESELAKVKQNIGNRLNEPCPNSGDAIYMCPRCVRQLMDELLGGQASSLEQKKLDRPPQKTIKLPEREMVIKKKAVPPSARLDRPELREKMARMFWGIQINQTELMIEPAKWDRLNPEQREFLLRKADQILALFEPMIEEAKKQERERVMGWIRSCWDTQNKRLPRIFRYKGGFPLDEPIESHRIKICSVNMRQDSWQALKEGG